MLAIATTIAHRCFDMPAAHSKRHANANPARAVSDEALVKQFA